jgi:hypothetical protein
VRPSTIPILTLLLVGSACKKSTTHAGPPAHALEKQSDETGEVIEVSNLVLASARERGFEHLTETEQVIVTVWEVEAEVNNGGFDQYYFNSSFDPRFAPSALEKIGAPKMAAIVSRANAVFGPEGPARDRFVRQEKLEQLGESKKELLNKLDNEFYGYPEPLTTLMHRYMTVHVPELLARVRKARSPR